MDPKLLIDIKRFLEEEGGHIDFKNGNTDPTGTIDEGEVIGYKYLHGLLERINLEIQDDQIFAAVTRNDMLYMREQMNKPYLPGGLAVGLTTLMQVQEVVSSAVDGCIPDYGHVASKDMWRTYVLAMTVELMEFLQTLNWKPWKDKKEIDIVRITDEFADILAFQGIIIKYLDSMGIGPVQLAEAYAKKTIVNIDRFLGLHGNEYKQTSLLDLEE
jgi:hypothetical protein